MYYEHIHIDIYTQNIDRSASTTMCGCESNKLHAAERKTKTIAATNFKRNGAMYEESARRECMHTGTPH
jgi:hypothetical protein